MAACGGVACAIDWRGTREAGLERSPQGPGWRGPLNAVRALVERQLEHERTGPATIHLEPSQLAAIVSERLTGGRAIVGVAGSNAQAEARITVVLLALAGRRTSELEALARIVGERALEIVSTDEIASSRDFWREHASALGARMGAADRQIARTAAQHAAIEGLISACRKLRPQNRFAKLGTILARTGPFSAWLIAARNEGVLRVIATSTAFEPTPEVGSNSALADSIRRNKVTVHRRAQRLAAQSDGAQLLPGASAYLCAPIGGAVVVLRTDEEVTPAIVSEMEQITAHLAPIVETWLLEDEIARLQQLVRSLGIRMFGAVDTERQRIARDLHDHLAQLLTAARIALDADPQEARGILKQLDQALRIRVRELRPATLGRSSLREALRYELRRLADAGIKGRLLRPEGANRMPQAIQELCYQVTREAFSNVIRHAAATRVEVATERRSGRIFLRIDDNGKGPTPRAVTPNMPAGGAGMGLRGMAERLELMGGQLKLERVGSVTRLTAEIPVR